MKYFAIFIPKLNLKTPKNMGVPRLYPWICKNFPHLIKHFQEGHYRLEVDNLYLDSNGLLHPSAQLVFNYGDNKKMRNDYEDLSYEEKRTKTFEKFFQDIEMLTKIVIPKKRLFIAIDGPAPIAKQSQQRERRFGAMPCTPKDGENDTQQFSSTEISPGTIFEFELTKYLHTKIRKKMNNDSIWRNIEVIFSPPTSPGEGEHTCLDHMRANANAKNESNCIFGPDGDLIMLALSAHLPNIFLFRQDLYNPGYFDVLNFGTIREELKYKLFRTNKKEINRNLNDISDDFILIGFFVGNDFLPKIQMFTYLEDGLELMLTTYDRISKGGTTNLLTKEGKIRHESFVRFVEELARREHMYLLDQRKVEYKDPRFIDKTLLSCIGQAKSGAPVLNMDLYREKYYAKSGVTLDEDGESEEVRKMCLDYLRMIAWVFEYYVITLPSWHDFYPWHYAPLMGDLVEVMKTLSDEEYEYVYSFKDKGEPSLPFVQLLCILPPSRSHLIPPSYGKLMTSKSSKLVKSGMYPKKFKVDYEGKIKEHMGVVLLPFVDIKLVKEEYKKVVTKKILKRNTLGRPESFVYNKKYASKYTSDYGDIKNNHVVKSFL